MPQLNQVHAEMLTSFIDAVNRGRREPDFVVLDAASDQYRRQMPSDEDIAATAKEFDDEKN